MGSPEGINGMLLLLQENSIAENGKKCKKKGNGGLNSFSGIDIPPSGPLFYLTVDLAFIQGYSVILCLKAVRHFTRIIMFFVTVTPFIDN